MNAPPSLLDVYAALDRMHAWRGWHWWPDPDPFEVCVGAILVQNTMWTNVERALERLRAAGALDPQVMAALSEAELEELVRPSGQYRQKARKLRAFLGLAESEGGLGALFSLDAPVLRGRLLATWGIGPETADCIVCYAARMPALAIDAYTMRLFGRLGLGPVQRAMTSGSAGCSMPSHARPMHPPIPRASATSSPATMRSWCCTASTCA